MATFVRATLNSGGVTQHLFRLDHPIDHGRIGMIDHVVVSRSEAPSLLAVQGHGEIYAFPASADGDIIDWAELPGSTKDTDVTMQSVADDVERRQGSWAT
jgi:hypothetical protein